MRNIIAIIVATVACTLALTACGGDGDGSGNDSTLSRADEGIWSYIGVNQGSFGFYDQTVMQAVVLSDGTYWGISGGTEDGLFSALDILHGTASVDDGKASGTYMDFRSGSPGTMSVFSEYVDGTYAGTASEKNNLDLIFNSDPDPMTNISIWSNVNFNMGYDNIYNQPASLAAIAGDYQQAIVTDISSLPLDPSLPSSNYKLSISGSNLTLVESDTGNVMFNGTIAPHGTVNVFDVSLTATAASETSGNIFMPSIPAGTTYKGILFQTSGALKNYIELVTAAGNNVFFYIGTK